MYTPAHFVQVDETQLAQQTKTPPWYLPDAPVSYIEKLYRGLACCKSSIERMQGQFKFSQNNTEQNINGVI